VALASAPEWLCIVPERRMELTTEGGLNIADGALRGRLIKVCELIRKHLNTTRISLFIDAKETTLQHLSSLKGLVDAVEIHTGDYARDFINNNSTEKYLDQYAKAWEIVKKNQLGFHAGHGLTNESLNNLLEQALFEEYNIGHWIIAESVYKGIGKVVSDLKTQIKQVCQKQPSE
jgi:pyridoxine 5-phosphate synthase